MNPNPNKERWLWVLSEKERCIREIRTRGLSRSDAEEVFSMLLVRWSVQDRRGQLPKVIHWGFLRRCLRQVLIDFVQKASAAIRGGNKVHVALDDVSLECPIVEFSYPLEWKETAIPILDRIEPYLNKRQGILLKVMKRMILAGIEVESWTDGFTSEEREQFMKNETESGEKADARFAKQVSRTFSEILKKIEELVRKN